MSALGTHFCGNGDLLTFALRCKEPVNPETGPVITSAIRFADAADGSDDMRALSENIVRAALNPVDQWRAVELLLAKNWTEAAIATLEELQ